MMDLLSELGSRWVEYFGFALLQNTLFISLLLLVLHLLRRAPANLKYTICLIGLVKLLLPPIIPAGFLSGLAAGRTTPLRQVSGVILTLPAGGAASGAGVAPAGASYLSSLSLPGLLLLMWIVGATLYLVSAMVSSLRLQSALKQAVPIEGTFWTEGPARADSTHSTCSAGISIYKSDRIPMPLTFGVFPRRIYVPEAWDSWSDRCRRMVVEHEMAHIRRWDGLVQVLQIVASAVYFFNPLVWWLNRRTNQYREMVCDDAVVLGSNRRAMEYSHYLVEMAESVVRAPGALGPASALLRCRDGLLARIHYQIREGTMKRVSRRRKGFILVGLIALILPLSWYCGSAETTQDVGPASAGKQDVRVSSDAASLEKYKDMEIVEIRVTAGDDGEIKVDGEPVAPEDLAQRLDDLAGEDKDKILILLRPEDLVRMEIMRKIQDTLVEKGLRKVIYDKESPGFDDLTLILPSKLDQKRLEDIPEEYIAVLEVRPGGKATLDGEPIELWDVSQAIEDKLAENPKLVVLIRSFNTGAFDDFAITLALVKKGGATRIAIDIPESIELPGTTE